MAPADTANNTPASSRKQHDQCRDLHAQGIQEMSSWRPRPLGPLLSQPSRPHRIALPTRRCHYPQNPRNGGEQCLRS